MEIKFVLSQLLKVNNSLKFFKILPIFLIFLIPISLATGPAIPDVSISLVSLFFIYLFLKERKTEYFNTPIILIFFIWCFYLILRSLLSDDVYFSLETSLFYFRFGFFVLAFLYFLKEKNFFLKYFTFFLCITLFVVSLDGIIQFLFKSNLIGFKMPELSNYEGRISGFFKDELILGSYLSRLMPLALGLLIFISNKQNSINKFFIIFLTFINSAIFISGERSAFFYCILSNIIFLIYFSENRKNIILSIISSFAVILLLTQFNNSTYKRMINLTLDQFTNMTQQENYYVAAVNEKDGLVTNKNFDQTQHELKRIHIFSSEHEYLYTKALKIFSKNILFGIGTKNFRIHCKNYFYSVYEYSFMPLKKNENNTFKYGCANHPHNIYLQLLSETGIIGTIPIIIFLFYIVYLFLKIILLKIKKIKNEFNDVKICMLTSVLIALWPLIPTGSFFNNWLSVINFLSLSFFIFFLYKKN